MFKFLFSCTILLFVIVLCESSKILGVFPLPSISHQVVFRPLMLELAKRGHDVTVITTDPIFAKGQTPQNYTEIDVHDVSYGVWHSFRKMNQDIEDRLLLFKSIFDVLSKAFEEVLKSTEIQNFLNEDKQFDLMVVESVMRPALVFSHIYNIPVIEFCTLGGVFNTYDSIGAATHPLIYPDSLHRRIYNLTIWEKLTELYVHYMSQRIYLEHINMEDEMLLKVLGPKIPSLSDLKKNVQMLFLNVNHIWDFNRPVPPNVIYLGAMHQNPAKDLPKDLKSYLDFSKHGVIYVSFGTNVNTSLIPQERFETFLKVFSSLPYDVLLKWHTDEIPNLPQNMKIYKWLPQSDLLRHPKVKLFITQGGLQSTDEAIAAGVPFIGFPMLVDQWLNVENYVKFRIGKQFSIETFTEDKLREAINDVISDESYRDNIVKLRNILQDQPLSSLERAVWWTEYVLRHKGASHLHTAVANISWAEYYDLELVIFLLVSTISMLFITIFTIWCIVIKVGIKKKVKIT